RSRARCDTPRSKREVIYPWAVNCTDAGTFGKMKNDGIAPAARSTDTEFLRRVSLDLTGQIPTPDAVKAFLGDGADDKRAKKIDELIASDGFVDRWTMWFGDLVQNVRQSTHSNERPQGRNAYYNFLQHS